MAIPFASMDSQLVVRVRYHIHCPSNQENLNFLCFFAIFPVFFMGGCICRRKKFNFSRSPCPTRLWSGSGPLNSGNGIFKNWEFYPALSTSVCLYFVMDMCQVPYFISVSVSVSVSVSYFIHFQKRSTRILKIYYAFAPPPSKFFSAFAIRSLTPPK